MTSTAILIPAAGASSRMGGRDKLLEPAGGQALLTRVTLRAVATGLPVFVAVPDPGHVRAALAREAGAKIVGVPDRTTGMAASIRAGIAALPADIGAAMILPADMPDLTADHLRAMAERQAETPDRILRATTADGRPGHPVIFPADLFGDLAGLTGDRGARDVIASHRDRLLLHPLPGEAALCDLDTPEQWARWRDRQ